MLYNVQKKIMRVCVCVFVTCVVYITSWQKKTNSSSRSSSSSSGVTTKKWIILLCLPTNDQLQVQQAFHKRIILPIHSFIHSFKFNTSAPYRRVCVNPYCAHNPASVVVTHERVNKQSTLIVCLLCLYSTIRFITTTTTNGHPIFEPIFEKGVWK